MNTRMFVPVLLIFLSLPAFAQENVQKAMARAQYMLKQVSAEKAALEAKNLELKNELEAVNKKMDAELKVASKEKRKLRENIGNWKAEYQKLKERFVEVSMSLRDMTVDRDVTAEKLAMQTQNYQLCYKDNNQLVGINDELLEKFNQKGPWDALVQREPVTGLGKVEMENLMQTYRHRIEDVDLGFNQHLIQKVEN